MFCPKKSFLGFLSFLLAIFSLFPPPLLASQKQYFDYGPYYQSSQVLGFSFSSLENLPALKLPNNLQLSEAKGILPDNPFYSLERIAENTQLAFTFDPVAKERLRLELATERLSEAKTLMGQDKTGAASQTLDDYSQTLADIAQNLPAIAQSNDQQTKDLISKAEELASDQALITTALSLTAPPIQAEGWAEAANTNRQVLDRIAEVKGEPVIPETLSTAIQQLKEEGLISEEESNKLYSLKNRSEVRDELNKLTTSGQLPPSEVVKLDEAVARRYPEVQEQQIANLQVIELRSYQTLPQPSEELVDQLRQWQDNPNIPPSNDIKPYLWYNRAEKLAKEVNLSDFSIQQQAELARFYPEPVTENSTYSPPPNPSPPPSPTPAAAPDTDTSTSTTEDQSATPAALPDQQEDQPSTTPSPAPVPTKPYLEETEGALPGQPTYILKQLGEGLNFALTFDPAEKTKIRIRQVERRLAEAQALSVDPKKAALYESTLKNYRSALADASNRLKQLEPTKTAKQLAEQLEAQAGRHEIVFEKGLLPPPAENPELISDVIKTTEDAMDRSADALGRPALPQTLASRLGDLKAQGLILPEEAEDLVRSASREEVREKIRKLVELNTFPLADAKKLDEAQTFSSPADYHQLIEVRKVEELQNLRSVQTELAQTPSLKTTASNLGQREKALVNSIDPSLISKADLGNREDLIETYEKLSSVPRPINSGQFGTDVVEATPGATPTPAPEDESSRRGGPGAGSGICPEGAVLNSTEGCMWADGSPIDNYNQYQCDQVRQYYSFAAKKCVDYQGRILGFREDAQPICPVGYLWSWYTKSCELRSENILPSPSPEPQPENEEEIEKQNAERSKYCPEGSSYKIPRGCVWDDTDKPLHDSNQYRCSSLNQYYSFDERRCINVPEKGQPYPQDATPACKEPGSFWSWTDGKCIPAEPLPEEELKGWGSSSIGAVDPPKPWVTPDSPFYFFKQAAETIQLATSFSPEARQETRASQAKERLIEAYAVLEKGNKEAFAKSLTNYTSKMQEIFNDVSKSSLSDETKKAIGEKLAKEAVEQNLLLQKLEVAAKNEDATVLSTVSSTVILGVDKAADLSGEPAVPEELKSKIKTLPEEMISEEDKKKLLETNSRVDARLKLGDLLAKGGLIQNDAAYLNKDFDRVDKETKWRIEELKKLEEFTEITNQKQELEEKVKKNEGIIEKLTEFQNTFEPGKEVSADIRPYVRLTRIEEVAQTIRPDIVKIEEFQNRKDVVLAVATLQQEFKPTKEAMQRVQDFRRRNPNTTLPPELARIEALSYSLGVRTQTESCFLPTPPFPANTPCPPPGSAIPVTSYYTPAGSGYGSPGYNTSWYSYGPGGTDPSTISTAKDGKPLVYGQGPKPESAGICPSGYHWMYDSGGWCMSNSGNYSSSYTYTPSGTGSGYTPYSPYYTAPGAPPATYGYPVGDNSPNDGCPYGYDSDGRGNCIPNSYPASSYQYSPPSYYGSAPNYYTTTPPAGTVPGSGPRPTAPGQCPSGYHWMSDSGGWCMADSTTYVPSGSYQTSYPGGTVTSSTPPAGGYNCGSQPYDPVTKRCKDGACPGGFDWDGSKCVARGYSGPVYSGEGSYNYTPSSYQYGCTPGYYWDGSKCAKGSYEGSGWSDTAARSGTYCQPPSGGCGSNSYWDYGTCSCRSSNSYYGGSGPTPSNYCRGLSCGGGTYLDYSTCSCKYSSTGGSTGSNGSTYSCSPPSGGCGSGWFDSSTCSCKQASSQGCYNVSASSCGSGWYFDAGLCTCRQNPESSTTTSGGTSGGSSSGSSSSGSCPSGYHWMSDNGGWCMQDGSGSTAPTPQPTSQPEQQQQSTPQPTSAPSTESTPAPTSAPSTESTSPPATPSP